MFSVLEKPAERAQSLSFPDPRDLTHAPLSFPDPRDLTHAPLSFPDPRDLTNVPLPQNALESLLASNPCIDPSFGFGVLLARPVLTYLTPRVDSTVSNPDKNTPSWGIRT